MLRSRFPVKTFTRITKDQEAGIAALIKKSGGTVDASDITRAALDAYLDANLDRGERPDPRQVSLPGVGRAPVKRPSRPRRRAAAGKRGAK